MKGFTQENFENCWSEAIEIMNSLEIPINYTDIESYSISNRSVTRGGCCRIRENFIGERRFTIELSEAYANIETVTEKNIIEVLIHELLHTVDDCQNHGKLWKSYAALVSNNTEYKISVRVKLKEGKANSAKYTFECSNCHAKTYFIHSCKSVTGLSTNPEKYRCLHCMQYGTWKAV